MGEREEAFPRAIQVRWGIGNRVMVETTRNLQFETRNISSAGFTLLESLLALALFSLMAAALYGTFFSLTRGSEAARGGMESRRELTVTLDMLRREIDAALFVRGNKSLRFVAEDRDIFGKPASTLDFTALSLPPGTDAPSSDQLAIRYRVIEKDRRLVLVREVKGLHALADPVPYPQMEEIEGFTVECYDGGKWVKSWDTSLNQGLPKAVRVTIRVKEGGKVVDFSAIAFPRVSGS